MPEKPKYARPYWLHFEGRRPACVEAMTPEEARALGAELGKAPVTSCDELPYPAEPRLNHVRHQDAQGGFVTPSFCHSPEQCKGKTVCPQRYSCTE